MSRPTVSIVVPAYNEERRLGALREALTMAVADLSSAGLVLLEAVIVDDGSTDRTAEMLAASPSEHMSLLRQGSNAGKGAAIAAGARAARGDLILIADADVATPFAEVGKLFSALRSGADIAIGSRDLPGSNVTGAPRHRVVLGRVFNALVRAMTGLRVRDSQCGFKLLKAALARELLAKQIVSGFAFDVELLMRANARGLRIAELPVLYDHGAHSTVNPASTSLRMGLDLLKLWWQLRVVRQGSHAAEDRSDGDASRERQTPVDEPGLQSHRQ